MVKKKSQMHREGGSGKDNSKTNLDKSLLVRYRSAKRKKKNNFLR